MSDFISMLVEMGFSRTRAEVAITKTNGRSLQDAMEWLLTNEETEPVPENNAPSSSSSEVIEEKANSEVLEKEAVPETSTPQEAKSIKCDDCGKLFATSLEVEYHAAKSGHSNFSECTEEKRPLSEDEKREQLAKIEAKLKQRRMERESKEKLEELEREKNRIRSGKDLLEAKRKQEDIEIKKVLEQRKREKQEEKVAKDRVRKQIEEDRAARRAKFGGKSESEVEKPVIPVPQISKPGVIPTYNDVRLQIRLTNGVALTQTFGAKEPLSAVRVFIEINRTDEPGPFSLRMAFPAKVFVVDDYDKPLESLGLAPSAVLIVTKA